MDNSISLCYKLTENSNESEYFKRHLKQSENNITDVNEDHSFSTDYFDNRILEKYLMQDIDMSTKQLEPEYDYVKLPLMIADTKNFTDSNDISKNFDIFEKMSIPKNVENVVRITRLFFK